ncbi:MAG TPA: FMN-binding protein [Candidatus Limnocylindrales bacterium]|nr:FMN-binding protein [Candidatus Limnocylindrales bacterium]
MLVAAGLAVLAGPAAPAGATVFHARDEALQLAFPDADRVEPQNHYLTDEQRAQIEKRARAKVESSLVTVYTGHRGGELLGYAIFDTHIVRTLPETFLVVLSPAGEVRATHVLAFHEPLEYLPTERWLGLFKGKTAADELRLGQEIAAITGSTLSAQAVTDGIRRVLAIHAVLLQGK